MILNAKSNYSLRFGTLSIDALIDEALRNNYDELALTDINNTSGMLSFVKRCQENGIRPIAGAEFRQGDELLYVAIARNKEGFRQINQLLTTCNVRKSDYPQRPDLPDCYVVYPWQKKVTSLRDNEYTGVGLSLLNKILTEPKSDQKKYVLLQSTTYQSSRGYELHKRLRAIDRNLLFSQLRPHHMAGIDEYLLPREKLLKYFEAFPHIIANTLQLSAGCHFDFDFNSVKNKKTFTDSQTEDKLLLEKIALEGFKTRYQAGDVKAANRLREELVVIDRLGFSAYFLITWDMVQFSLGKGFYHYGRGSGANSIVAYCLRITDVCPVELDLYFERFLNPKRNTPPDFDIDYSWKDRDQVYDYMFKKYGRQHTALLGAMVTFQDRSIIREMGKINGLPKEDIDRMIDHPTSALNQTGLCREILSWYDAIADYPSVRSIHAGGILISEEPLTCYTALDLPPKGYLTTQFDMHTAELAGFEKLDILSQRGLGHIRETEDLVLKNRNIRINARDISTFKKDPVANRLLETGDTIGCFYVESPAMRALLRKLHCNDYLTLVAASSIIRPGVAKSGMMKAYIHRKNFPKDVSYAHPILEEQLSETFGVMVYQEDVIKVAHYFGGLDLADADVLRRMMSGKGKDRELLAAVEQKYYRHCDAQAYPRSVSEEVWRQIATFAGFSFAKGHSASYAAESYQSLYLKAHYPLEFMVAVINNFGGFYRTRVYVNEARRLGASIHLPCVNRSKASATLYGKELYLGFVHVKSLQAALVQDMIEERAINGDYSSLDNFRLRTNVSLEQLIILIRIDAFRFTGHNKRALLWEAHMLYSQADLKRKDKTAALFEDPPVKWELPALQVSKLEDAYDELELLDFPVSMSEFDLLKTTFRGDCGAADLSRYVGQTVRLVGNYIAHKNLRTPNGGTMAFGTFTDTAGHFFDTVHFPPVLHAWPFRGWGAYLLLGKVTEDYGVASVEIQKMARLEVQLDERHS